MMFIAEISNSTSGQETKLFEALAPLLVGLIIPALTWYTANRKQSDEERDRYRQLIYGRVEKLEAENTLIEKVRDDLFQKNAKLEVENDRLRSDMQNMINTIKSLRSQLPKK